MIELYHWEPNTFSLKPLIVLHEKGLSFKSHYVDFLSLAQYDLPANDAVEVRHNPEGSGPILVDEGVPMTESFFISLYLDEAYPAKPLRRGNAYCRWKVLMWARFVNEVLAPAVSTLGCHKYLGSALEGRDRVAMTEAIARLPTKEQRDAWTAALKNDYPEELLDDSRRKIGLAVKKVEDSLAQNDWLGGDAYSLADIDVFALLASAPDLAGDVLNSRVAPRTFAWVEHIKSRPAVKAAFATSKTGKPLEAFAPGPEHSRWC
jgi:GSH-dependent disulfide-bond oxidoreductase